MQKLIHSDFLYKYLKVTNDLQLYKQGSGNGFAECSAIFYEIPKLVDSWTMNNEHLIITIHTKHKLGIL